MKTKLGSFKWKLAVFYACLFGVIIVLLGLFILGNLRSSLYRARYRELKFNAGRISDTITLSYTSDEDELSEIFAQVARVMMTEGGSEEGLELYLLDAEGELIASRSGGLTLADRASRTILRAMNGKETEDLYVHSIGDNSELEVGDYALPVLREGKLWYILFLRQPVTDIQETLTATSRTIMLASLIAILIAAILGYLVSTGITGPIRRLTLKTQELASGNLDEAMDLPIREKTSDEIEELESNFNLMARDLSLILSEANSERNKLETIFHHMADGLVVYDINGNVVQSNPIAQELMGRAIGQMNFSNAFPGEQLKKLLYTPQGMIEQRMWALDEHFVQIGFAAYQNELGVPEGLIVVLQDVTDQQRSEQMQREFVANVSHELRTPITTIKSYVETILEGGVEDEEMRSTFLQTIDQESDRMNELINELLELSRMDNRQVRLNLYRLEVSGFLQECIERYQILAERKVQTMEMLDSQPGYIRADRARIEQVVRNVLTNAVNYSPTGARISAWTTVNEEEHEVTLHIRDTGMGIPYKEQKRIFDRFYRIDKARSRSSGGTGLGLAIAREMMELHGGRIELDSIPGTGSTFHLIFPESEETEDDPNEE